MIPSTPLLLIESVLGIFLFFFFFTDAMEKICEHKHFDSAFLDNQIASEMLTHSHAHIQPSPNEHIFNVFPNLFL